jgi:uncharacterized repeat protein (TIGR01451 family)
MENRNFSRGFIFAAAALSFATLFSAPILAQDAPPTNTDLKFHKFVPATPPENNASAAPARQAATPDAVNAAATQQIQLLLQEKSARTPAQQKIDSNVLFTIRMMRGEQAAPGFQSLYTGVDLDDQNRIVVDIVADVTPDLLQKLQSAGALVLSSYPAYRAIRAIVPPNQIESIASSPDVSFIGRKAQFLTAGFTHPSQNYVLPSGVLAYSLDARAARVKEVIGALLQQRAGTNSTPGTINTGQGSVTTEGDATHLAAQARGVFGINGSGLKIGVLSDSANVHTSATNAQATGDLPPTCPGPGGPCFKILADSHSSNDTDEGTAMMEIIYDLAPGASLEFATANTSEAGFASNILALQADGCNIIVDDVGYFDEPVFQDGIIAQSVNTVTAAGVLYFSSAGNEGHADVGSAGYFEGDFVAGGSPTFSTGGKTGSIHNFHNGLIGDLVDASGEANILEWADLYGSSANDYDLYYTNISGTVIASSTNLQTGIQNPFEQIDPPPFHNGDMLVVFKTATASPLFFALNTLRGQMSTVTTGQTHGHSSAAAAFSVAATPAAGSFALGDPNGPYPGPFTVFNNLVERFSSDGPRRMFYNPDGTPVTPGNFSSTGGTVRNKPDITAADGVSTTLPLGTGLNPFYGTSAAAPHAAAIAALILSAKPSLTPAQVRTTLTTTAIDIQAAGFDVDSGSGTVMAYPAVSSLGLTPGANPEIASVVASENPGNGNGVIEAGEGASLVVQLKNPSGVASATGITAVLATTTPGVIISQPSTAAYADLPVGSTVVTNLTPFTFTLSPDAACALNIEFTLSLTFTGGPNPTKTLNFSVQTGILNITNNLGTTAAGLPAGITFATGSQTDRLSRNGVPLTCLDQEAFPGTIPTGSRTFDSYTFTALQNGCQKMSLTSPNGANIFQSIYTPNFTPSNIVTNYLGDAGSGGSPQGFSFFPFPGHTYAIVISDSSLTGTATGSTYTVPFPLCLITNPSTINHPPIVNVQNVRVVASTLSGTTNADINFGSFDPDPGDTITLKQTPPGPYPVGVTTVVLTVVDSKGATAQNNATVTVFSPLEITKSHAGDFALGQVGATYTLTVNNLGTQATNGSVTVTDNLPSSLSAAAISGAGWTCVVASVSCTRSDSLVGRSSYPQITVTVDVAQTAPLTVTNSATASGGGLSNGITFTATDPTTIDQPDLIVQLNETTGFAQGQTAAMYTVFVTNGGAVPTTGPSNLTITLPAGLAATSLVPTPSPDWSCTLAILTCTTNSTIGGGLGARFALTVNVAANAPATGTTTATVSGGGETITSNDVATDVVNITPEGDLTITLSHTGNFFPNQIGATYTIVVSNVGASPSGVAIRMIDMLPTGLTATGLAGTGWSCGFASAQCSRNDPLSPGTSYPPITLTVSVASNVPSSLTTSVTVSGDGEINTSNDAASDVTLITLPPDLAITKTHSGNFTQGQHGGLPGGPAYSITVTNSGGGPTTSNVTVVDTLPSSLTATGMLGTGWACTLSTLTCVEHDPLAPGASYLPITLSVLVAASAPASVTNMATASGGGEVNTVNDVVTDVTAITQLPDMTIGVSHVGSFVLGQAGAVYTITALNSGATSTSGTVTVVDTLPAGLTATAMAGTGWSCTASTVTCTRSDVLAASSSYPAITLTVNVGANAGASVTNIATVSGGGEIIIANDTANDPTTITQDFSTAGPVSPVTVTAGQTANFTITLTPGPGGFSSPISFSASGLPAASSASFSPSSLTPGGTATSTMLSISTTARGILPPTVKRIPRTPPQFVLWLLTLSATFLTLTLLAFPRGRFNRRPRFALAMLIATVLITATIIAGCGGGGVNTPPPPSGTPAGTSTITVTAQSGGLIHTTTVTLTVQ